MTTFTTSDTTSTDHIMSNNMAVSSNIYDNFSNYDFNFIYNINNSNNTIINGNDTNGTIATTPYPFYDIDPLPLSSKVILIILYAFTTVAAVVGNSLAIIVFAQGKRSKTDLRPFLINLAIADLIMAIFCIPFTFAYQITKNWVFPNPMCIIVQFCQVVSVTASVCTNTCIGIDRLIAVKFPMRKRVTSSKSKVVIVLVWILAWCMGVFPLVFGKTTVQSNGKMACEERFPDRQSQLAHTIFVTIVTYFLPVTILTVTYSMISHQLWNRSIPGHSDDMRDAHQLKSKRKVVKMLSTVVLLFGVCWLPLHLFFIIISFNNDVFGEDVEKIYVAFHLLSMANSFVNPVIYGFMNDNFRADLRNLCQACICRQGQRGFINRSPPLRWRAGQNVHDSFSPDSQHLHHPLHHPHHPHHHHHPSEPPATVNTAHIRHHVEMKSATKPKLWQNGRSKTNLGLTSGVDDGSSSGGGDSMCGAGGSSIISSCSGRDIVDGSNNSFDNSKSKNRIWRPNVVREGNRNKERNQTVRYGLVRNGVYDHDSCSNGCGRDGVGGVGGGSSVGGGGGGGGYGRRDGYKAVATYNGCEPSIIDRTMCNGRQQQQQKPHSFRGDVLS